MLEHRISIDRYLEFVHAWDTGRYPHQRLGQAFMNEFLRHLADPDLFHERSRDAAAMMILQKYVNTGENP